MRGRQEMIRGEKDRKRRKERCDQTCGGEGETERKEEKTWRQGVKGGNKEMG